MNTGVWTGPRKVSMTPALALVDAHSVVFLKENMCFSA
jgi:hypothetical protein